VKTVDLSSSPVSAAELLDMLDEFKQGKDTIPLDRVERELR